MEMLLAICGHSGSGKSTVARAITESASQLGTAVVESLGRVIYEIHDAAYDIMEQAGVDAFAFPITKDRRLLQMLGDDWGRITFGQDIWVDTLIRRINSKYTAKELVVVDDLRTLGDAAALRAVFGPKVFVVKLSRAEGRPLLHDGGIANHSSEREIDSIDADIEVSWQQGQSPTDIMIEIYEQLERCFSRRVANGLITISSLTEAEVEAALVQNLNNQ